MPIFIQYTLLEASMYVHTKTSKARRGFRLSVILGTQWGSWNISPHGLQGATITCGNSDDLVFSCCGKFGVQDYM